MAEHPGLVDPDLFKAVQDRLNANRQAHTRRRQPTEAPLLGLVSDDRDNRMGPSYATKNGVRYRYYVSAAVVQGRKHEAGSVARVPATELETVVIEALAAAGHELPEPVDRDMIAAVVERITVGAGTVTILLQDAAVARDAVNPIAIAWSPPPFRRRRAIIAAADGVTRPIRVEARSRLLRAIARGRAWLDELMSGAVASTDAIAARETVSERTVRSMLSLAFLAPDIVEAAADGTLPRGFGLSRLTDLPLRWDEQRSGLGIAT